MKHTRIALRACAHRLADAPLTMAVLLVALALGTVFGPLLEPAAPQPPAAPTECAK